LSWPILSFLQNGQLEPIDVRSRRNPITTRRDSSTTNTFYDNVRVGGRIAAQAG